MKYLDEYRDPAKVKALLKEIESVVTENWVIMEICGGQTHAFLHNGLDAMLPSQIELVHGPGCPVCVTPLEQIDRALAIASRPDVIFTSYGDMLRVPGSAKDLFAVRAQGGDVRIVYSPLEAVQIAEANPDKQVVFFAIGFETTAPANAMAVLQAKKQEYQKFFGAGITCPGATGDGSDPQFKGKPRAGIPGCRSRLRGDGIPRISAYC